MCESQWAALGQNPHRDIGSDPDLFPDCADGFHRCLGDTQVSLPITATYSNATNTLAVDQDWHATLHGRPPVWTGSERKANRMARIEVLTGRTLGRSRASIRCSAHGLCRAGICCVETTTIHAFKQNQMPPGVNDRTGRRDPGLCRQADGRRHDLLCTLIRKARALGGVNDTSSALGSEPAPSLLYVVLVRRREKPPGGAKAAAICRGPT